jgi:hypothetical protein
MKPNRHILTGTAASLAIPTTAALAALYSCYQSYNWVCCKDWSVKCTHTSIVEPPDVPVVTNWYCLQDSDALGFDTVAAMQAQNGQHLSSDPGILRGTCMVTPRTCGALPNQCNIGTPYQVECRDAVLTGSCSTTP